MSTVADFLRSKLGNMLVWLKKDGFPVDMRIEDFNNLQITAFAVELNARYQEAVKRREFGGLRADKEIDAHLLMMVSYVERNPHLHDKFWRYLELFSDTVTSDGGGPPSA